MNVVLPKVALTMTEAVIVEWLVEEGAEVRKGQPIFTMETDKTEVEVESPGDGVLRDVRVAAGETAAAGAVVAVVATDGDAPAGAAAPPAGRSVAPAAAALAEQLGVDLSAVRGTGTGGRVLEVDVMNALGAPAQAAEPERDTEPVAVSKARAAGMRLTEHSARLPTFLLADWLDLGGTASPTDAVAVAAAAALRDVPIANACVRDGRVLRYRAVRIGILVRDGDALVPLVFDEPAPPLQAFHDQRVQAQEALAGGRLAAARTSGATFVISNLGRYGVDFFSAVLYPETAITLALGAVGSDPARPGAARAVLTCDHRIVDGVDAAEFMAALRQRLRETTEGSDQ